jgi:flagellar motor switch protein FliM
MLDRLLGGSSFTPSRINNLTEIDTIVLEHLFSRAILSLQEAWKNIIDIHPQLETLETNPQFIQIVSPNETVALISMSMKIGETTGMINLCIPHVVIEPIMPKLTVNNLFFTQKKNRAPEELEVLQERLNLTSMTIIAELGSSTINVREFLNLAVGDVISLNKQLDETLDIKVGERYKFTGTPGTSKGKLAVQVADFVTEGGKNNDE